jgi:hypothetical protein
LDHHRARCFFGSVFSSPILTFWHTSGSSRNESICIGGSVGWSKNYRLNENVPGFGLARPNRAQKSSGHKFSATESTGSGNLFYALLSFPVEDHFVLPGSVYLIPRGMAWSGLEN